MKNEVIKLFSYQIFFTKLHFNKCIFRITVVVNEVVSAMILRLLAVAGCFHLLICLNILHSFKMKTIVWFLQYWDKMVTKAILVVPYCSNHLFLAYRFVVKNHTKMFINCLTMKRKPFFNDSLITICWLI